MTQLGFTGEYDDYGFPHSQLTIAVPRGRNPLADLDAASEPYLSTYAITEYARRDDDGIAGLRGIDRGLNRRFHGDRGGLRRYGQAQNKH